jgi:acylphosphatase
MTQSDQNKNPVKRLSVRFEGRVQGVGFRFTTVRIAQGFEITGFVRNEPDGDVLVIAEGPQDELQAFFQAIRRSSLGRNIVNEHMDWRPPTGEFSRFDVQYGRGII